MEDDSDEDEQFEIDNSDISMIGEITLRHRQRIRSVSPSRVRTTARSVVLSKNARMRIRACTTIPGASEGVLPPDSRPVNSYEALHHLAKRVYRTNTCSLIVNLYSYVYGHCCLK